MRPIEKLKPGDKLPSGKVISKTYNPHGKAKDVLIDNIGKYCSFCEVPVPPKSSLEVEHIKFKDGYPNLKFYWGNFLLGCKNCNPIKGTKKFNLDKIHLPHCNNTFLSFEIRDDGFIQVNPALDDDEKSKAEKLSWLIGIERRPGYPDYSRKDDRWSNRREAWKLAKRYLSKYDAGIISIEYITDLAKANGFFTVWMTVFSAHPEVRQALIDAFPGTAKSCFELLTTVPLKRNGDKI
ncbi:MAG: hypothetical protein IT258_04915 [Saprospiraceae bacterium]|nr:hypothetical protein [Saprospiraceae bacterium]